jgi:long-subunit fatty acid transport protein
MPKARIILPYALLLCQLLAAGPASALTDEEIFRDLRFNFINPGGRSLAMGGAFVSLANDATAAQANPAGLTTMLSSQLFAEIRFASPDDIKTSTSFRDPINPSDGFDVNVTTSPNQTASPSFISYTYPLDRVSFGVSRQEVISIDNRTTSNYDFLFGTQSDIRRAEGTVKLGLVNWNLSAAYRVTDKFRVGLTVSFGILSLDSSVVNSYVDPTGTVIGVPELAGVPLEMYRTTGDDSDSDVTATLGLLWKISDTLAFGASYRQGGSFEVQQVLGSNPIDAAIIPGTINSTVFLNESGTVLTADNSTYAFDTAFNVPDVAVVGISWTPLPQLTLALDATRISYSDLLKGFNSRLNILTAGFQNESDATFTVDDQTNLHFGAEYMLPAIGEGTIVLLRAGYHQDKDNRVRSDFAPGGFGLGSNDNFPGAPDNNHYSLGAGVVVGNSFQLDAAADFSDRGSEAVLSLIYKF